MFQRNAWVVLGLAGLAAMGCSKETTSSTNIKTAGIAALIDVTAKSADKATVKVELRVGGSSSNTFVVLVGGDKLVATAAGQTKTLTSDSDDAYSAEFTGVEEDTLFTVNFERPTDTSAPGNSGTMPPPFEVTAPASDLSRKDDALEITWDPAESGNDMNLKFDGTCIFGLTKSPADTGSYTVPKGTLDSTGGDMPETCKIGLELERARTGEADSAFDDESYFRLHQFRSTSFTSAP